MPERPAFRGSSRGTARAKAPVVLNINDISFPSRPIMKKSFVSLLAFAAISLNIGIASADYVCKAEVVPSPANTGGGNYGYFFASVYSGPDCSGSYVGSYYFCSTGASFGLCADWVATRGQSAEQMAILAGKVIDAAQWNLPISVQPMQCILSSLSNCGGFIYFN
jgi:hypothetical protein